MLRRDAGTRVAHPEQCLRVRPGRRERDLAQPTRRQRGHRLYGIGDQVEEHLLQLVAVAENHDRVRAQRLLELDAVELHLVLDEQRGPGYVRGQIRPPHYADRRTGPRCQARDDHYEFSAGPVLGL